MDALPLLSAAFAAGIMFTAKVEMPVLLPALLGAAAAAATMILTVKKKPAAAALLFLFLVLGMFVCRWAIHSISSQASPLLQQEGAFYGYVREVQRIDEESASFLFVVEEWEAYAGGWQKARATIRVRVYRPLFQPAVGMRLAVRGTPVKPQEQRNRGGFNYAAYLETWGAGAVMAVRGRDVTVLAGRGGSIVQYWAWRCRDRAQHLLATFLPEREAGLAAGLLLGERQAVFPDTAAAYRRLGIAHLLAVSGLHVGFVAAFALFFAARLFGRRKSRHMLLAVLLVLAYVFITGARPPVWRAALASFLALAAREAGREDDGLQSLAAAGLLMLFARPLWLLNLSFQFSFAATAGILLLTPRLQSLFTKLPRSVGGALAVTLAAQLAVLPLQAAYFGVQSVLAVPVNLICVPLVAVTMLLGVAGLLAGLLYIPFAGLLFTASLPALMVLEQLPRLLALLPFASLRIPALHPAIWAVYLVILALFATGVSMRPFTGKKIIVLLILLNLLMFAALPGAGQRGLEATFLDVGQGFSLHVRTPAGRHMLIDGGSEKNSSGTNVLLPYLRANRVHTLHMVVLTHPHEDHYGGLAAVVANMPVKMFLYNGEAEASEAFSSLLGMLREKKVPLRTVEEGYRLLLDGMQIEVLSPPRERFRFTGDDVNNNSLVMRIGYGDFSLLVTGDAEAEAMGRLLREHGAQLQCTVLQAPHHGSRDTLSDELMKAAGFRAAVIPVGRNLFGHPHTQTLEMLAKHRVETYRSDLHGAVTVDSDGKTWSIRPYVRD